MRALLPLLLLLLIGCGQTRPSSPLIEQEGTPLSEHNATETNTTAPKPRKTIVFFIHGYHKEGATHHGIYGEPVLTDMLIKLRHYTHDPILTDTSFTRFSRALATAWYYGDTPPSYYSAEDIEEIDALTAEYGGGIPRYAAIVAKFIDYMLRTTHAERAEIVSVSMGSLVTRWLIEKDLAHLASRRMISRWYSLEGVIAGNYAASSDRAMELAGAFDPQSIDVKQMRYGWIAKELHAPSEEGANPLYSHIVVGFESSTDDRLNNGALSLLSRLNGSFRPNDGVQLVRDTYFHPMLPEARALGLPPMHTFFHQNHYALSEDEGAYAAIVAALTGTRRVRITLTQAQIEDIHEGKTLFFDNRPAEIVFASAVHSPRAAERWMVSRPIDERTLKSGILPIVKYDHDHQSKPIHQILFDAFVLPGETQLTLDLHAFEIDYDDRYHMQELTGHRDEDLGSAQITLPLVPGDYTLAAPNWSARLHLEIVNYD